MRLRCFSPDGDLMLTINSYYEIIHPIFPLLPDTKARAVGKWGSLPASLRDGLDSALQGAVHSFPSSTPVLAFPVKENSRNAKELWSAAQREGSGSRSMSSNLAYLQILLFLAIEAGNRAPVAARGQVASSQLSWLGSALTLAYELKLHQHKAQVTDDPDSDERIGRRLWFCLLVMDKWHAASTSTPPLVSDTTVALLPDDRSLLAESVYQLTRKCSYILLHAKLIFQVFLLSLVKLQPSLAQHQWILQIGPFPPPYFLVLPYVAHWKHGALV
jgi:hypothetical protein